MYVHGVIGHQATHFCYMIFENGGRNGRFFACVYGRRSYRTCRIHDVGMARNSRQRFLYALKIADRQIELLAQARVRAASIAGGFRTAGRVGWQGYTAAYRKNFHQHAPALTRHLEASDNEVEWHEYVLALRRSVLKCGVQRKVASADRDPRQMSGNQRGGNTIIIFVPDQVFRIIEFECEAEHRGYRRQRDVTLFPVEPHADDRPAIKNAFTNHTVVRNRCGV